MNTDLFLDLKTLASIYNRILNFTIDFNCRSNSPGTGITYQCYLFKDNAFIKDDIIMYNIDYYRQSISVYKVNNEAQSLMFIIPKTLIITVYSNSFTEINLQNRTSYSYCSFYDYTNNSQYPDLIPLIEPIYFIYKMAYIQQYGVI